LRLAGQEPERGGGDVAAPALRPESGGKSQKFSDFPNAEYPMGTGDRITGLHEGRNVNWSRAQLLAPLVDLIRLLIAEELKSKEK
jgi:hypothetical protein